MQLHVQGGNSLLQSEPDTMDNYSDMIGLSANELILRMFQT